MNKINRILKGVRLEDRLAKTMQAEAKAQSLTIGELVERVFLQAMRGGNYFTDLSRKDGGAVFTRLQSLEKAYGSNKIKGIEDLIAKK